MKKNDFFTFNGQYMYSKIFNIRAFALPLALFFVFLTAIFCFMMIKMNVQSKKQRNSTLMSTKAYFMALAGIQHFKLKCNLLPEEFFKCSTIYYGFSPFYTQARGAKFDLFDKPSDAGPFFYPEFLAAFMEDINSFTNDIDGTVKNGKTVKDARTLISLKEKKISQYGECPTWHFAIGGFKLEDALINDTIAEWGYKITNLECGSLQKEYKINEPPFIEQSISLAIEGCAKINTDIRGLNAGESEYVKNTVNETFIFRRQIVDQ